MKLHQRCNPIALILVLYAVCSCGANLISNSNSLPDRYNYHSWNTYSTLGCLQKSLCAGTHLLYYKTCPPSPSNSLHFCNTHKNLLFTFACQGCIHQNEGKISSQMLLIQVPTLCSRNTQHRAEDERDANQKGNTGFDVKARSTRAKFDESSICNTSHLQLSSIHTLLF